MSNIFALISSSRAHLRSLLASARRWLAFIKHVSSSSSGSRVNRRFTTPSDFMNTSLHSLPDKNCLTVSILIFVVALVCGCASVGNNFDSRKVSEIKKGETTERDLVKMFGPPSNRIIDSDRGLSLRWIYTEVTTKGTTFIPVVGAFAGGTNTKTKFLNVFLDTDGKVFSFNYDGGGLETTTWVDNDPEAKPVKALKSPKQQ